MGGALSVDGLVSNLDTSSIIQQLLAVERKPIEGVQKKISKAEEQRSAYLDLSSRILALQGTATRLGAGDVFARTKVSSSNTNAIVATGSSVSALGSFNFRVARLATIGQSTSSAFASKSSLVATGAATLKIEEGDARLEKPTELGDLNGFTGVQRGKFTITDGNGRTSVIDIGSAVTVQDVIDLINADTNVDATASLKSDREGLKLVTTTASLTINEYAGGSAAADLGLLNGSFDAPTKTLTGTDVRNITRDTPLAKLNDGRGVDAETASATPASIAIRTNLGQTTVSFSSATQTVGDVIDAIQAAIDLPDPNLAGLEVGISADGNGLYLGYRSGQGAANAGIEVVESGGKTAEDLGLLSHGTVTNKLVAAAASTEVVHLDFALDGGTTANLALRDTSGNQTKVNTSGTAANLVTFAQNGIDYAGATTTGGTGATIVDGSTDYIAIGNSHIDANGNVATGASGILDQTIDDAGTGTKKYSLAFEFQAPADPGANHVLVSGGGADGATAGFNASVNTGTGEIVLRLHDGGGVNSFSFTSTGTVNWGGANRVVISVDHTAGAAVAPTVTMNVNGTTGGATSGTGAGAGTGYSVNMAGSELRLGKGTGGVGGLSDAAGWTFGEFQLHNDAIVGASDVAYIQGERRFNGARLVSKIDSALLTSLNGSVAAAQSAVSPNTAVGASKGAFTVNDGSATLEFDLRSFQDLNEFYRYARQIGQLSGQDISYSTENSAGLGIKAVDAGGGALTITGTNSVDGANGATRLFSGNQSSTTGTITTMNAQRATMTLQTRLETLNGGKGVALGKFQIQNTSGATGTVDLSSTTNPPETIKDVIDKIDAIAGINARINDTGDGILVVDIAGGGGTLTISEINGGTSAKDLKLIRDTQDTSSTQIDGTHERSITLSATTKLSDVSTAVDDLELSLTTGIINDGNGLTPYRLNLVSKNAGAGGFFTAYTTGSTTLSMSRTSLGEDAALLFGSTSAGTDPVLLKSHENTVTNAVSGLTLQLQGKSADPVTVSVTRDSTGIVDDVETFAEDFNSIVERIKELTAFDQDTLESGILLGDSTTNRILSDLQTMMIDTVAGVTAGYNSLLQVGFRFASDGSFQFTRSTFESKLSANFDAVKSLFTAKTALSLSTKVKDLNGGRGLGLASGTAPEFRVTTRVGTTVDIDFSTSTFVSDMLRMFNTKADATVGAGKLALSISSDGKKFVITDTTAASGTTSLNSLNSSTVLADLKFNATSTTDGELKSSEVDVFNLTGGVGNRVSDRLEFITDPIDGSLATKTDGIDRQIEDYERQIERLEERVAAVQDRLTREFTQLEIFLGQSQNTQQRLAQQLSAITAMRR